MEHDIYFLKRWFSPNKDSFFHKRRTMGGPDWVIIAPIFLMDELLPLSCLEENVLHKFKVIIKEQSGSSNQSNNVNLKTIISRWGCGVLSSYTFFFAGRCPRRSSFFCLDRWHWNPVKWRSSKAFSEGVVTRAIRWTVRWGQQVSHLSKFISHSWHKSISSEICFLVLLFNSVGVHLT